MHWNYTYGHVPTEGDQSVDVYATGSRDDVRRAYRRGVLADDEWDIMFEGTSGAARYGDGGECGRRSAARISFSAMGAPGLHGQLLHPDSGRSTLDLCRAPRIGAVTARRDRVS